MLPIESAKRRASHIAKAVELYNSNRLDLGATQKRKLRDLRLAAWAAVVCLFLTGAWMNVQGGLLVFFLFVGFCIFVLYRNLKVQVLRPAEQEQSAFIAALLPAIFSDVEGFQYSPTGNKLPRGINSALLPHFDEADLGSKAEGMHEGLPFSVLEARLRTTGSGGGTVFEGLILKFELAEKFWSQIFILKSKIAILRFASGLFGSGPDLGHVPTNDAQFDEAYDVFCLSKKTVEEFLNKDNRRRILELRDRFSEDDLSINIQDKRVDIMLAGNRNLFALPNIYQEINSKTNLNRVSERLDDVFELISEIKDIIDGKGL